MIECPAMALVLYIRVSIEEGQPLRRRVLQRQNVVGRCEGVSRKERLSRVCFVLHTRPRDEFTGHRHHPLAIAVAHIRREERVDVFNVKPCWQSARWKSERLRVSTKWRLGAGIHALGSLCVEQSMSAR